MAHAESRTAAETTLRRWLFLDAGAAAAAAVLMSIAGPYLAQPFGVSARLLLALAVVNALYGCGSGLLARSPVPSLPRVRLLIAANFAWTGVCVVMAARVWADASWLGVAYLLGEGMFVGALATFEARALAGAQRSG